MPDGAVGAENFKYSLHLGDSTGYGLVSCGKVIGFEVECDSNEVIDCCEELEVNTSSTFYDEENGCCSVFDISPTYSDCFYGIRAGAITHPNNVDILHINYPLIPVGSAPLDLSFGESNTICINDSKCHIGDSDMDELEDMEKATMTIHFLNKDGHTICTEEIEICYFCALYSFDDISYNFDDFSTEKANTPKELEDLKSMAITKNNFTLNPNPNNGEFELNFDLEINKELIISVHNSIGEVIYQINNKQYSKGRNSERITLQNLNNGVYYLNIQELDEVTTIPFVIRK